MLGQTWRDHELVVVDDGSRDGTAALVTAWIARDPRVRLLRQPPRGLAAALNAGLAACRSPLVARLDADDVAEPERLARQVAALDADPTLSVVDAQVRLFVDDGEPSAGMRRYEQWINGVLSPGDFDRAFGVECPVVHPAATFRLDAVRDVGGYRDGDFPEDYDLWTRMHARGHRFRKLPRVLVHQRDHAARFTRTDPRCRPAALRGVRERWLSLGPLRQRSRLVIWGGGRAGRPWLRWAVREGHDVRAVVDIDPRIVGGVRQGSVPVVWPDDLPGIEADLCLVAVGSAGARDQIRERLAALRPEWREGRSWFAVA